MFDTITMVYDEIEDRILVGADIDKPTAASFWLTRRLTLSLLTQAAELLSQTSILAAAASAQDRADVAAFEREAALSATQGALSKAQADAVERRRAEAERVADISIDVFPQTIRLTISGDRGGALNGELSRPLFQRLLSMIGDEAAKGDWMSGGIAPASEQRLENSVPAVRH